VTFVLVNDERTSAKLYRNDLRNYGITEFSERELVNSRNYILLN